MELQRSAATNLYHKGQLEMAFHRRFSRMLHAPARVGDMEDGDHRDVTIFANASKNRPFLMSRYQEK